MTIRAYRGITPNIADSAYIDESAVVIGDVSIGADASLWPTVVARGDVHSISIGDRTNIQDGSILHVTHAGRMVKDGFSLSIGNDVTVGHRVVLHGCRIDHRCLIGMGAIIMDGVVIDSDVIIGAGSIVTPGKHVASGSLWVGAPAKWKRDLTADEQASLSYSAEHYVLLKKHHR